MMIEEFAAKSVLPLRTIKFLHKEGLIEDPLRPEDQIGLQFFAAVFDDVAILQDQVAYLPWEERLNLLMPVTQE